VIVVSAHRGSDGIRICVTDNGPGIDPAILPRIFTARFSTKSSSPGLGLHIVRSIVSQNGGTVSAANRENGAGAAFSILLPNR
jgi:signal transduction histidine kinase